MKFGHSWQKPAFCEVKMDAEIGSYQEDDDRRPRPEPWVGRSSTAALQTATRARHARLSTGVALALATAILGGAPKAHAQDYSVLTQHNDNARSGVQNQEFTLTPSVLPFMTPDTSVDSGSIVQGRVYAQPLFVKGVPFPSGARDVVYVVDDTDRVYSFASAPDTGFTGMVLLNVPGLNSQRSLLGVGEHTQIQSQGQSSQMGIMGTPVIDGSTKRMYVVAKVADPSRPPAPYSSRTDNAKFVLHVLDLVTMADAFTPVVVSAAVNVPGGKATFVPLVQIQRTASLLLNAGGRKYVSFGFGASPGGGIGEEKALQHGWAFTYDVTSAPTLSSAYCSTRQPDSTVDMNPNLPGGIWQSGAGFSADPAGKVFLATGNGLSDANNDSEAIVQLTSQGNFNTKFTPANQAALTTNDKDIGAGAPIVLPHPTGASRVFHIGKDGTGYLINTAATPLALGQRSFQAVANPNINVPGKNGGDEVFWGNPVFYNNAVYYVGSNDFVKTIAWNPSTALLSNIANVSDVAVPADPPCGHRGVALSAGNNAGAVLWVMQEGGGSTCDNTALLAYDPTKRNSPAVFTWHDAPNRQRARFPSPTIANGNVYLISSPVSSGPSKLVAVTFFIGQ
ncbi:MAG: hypothetical protein M3O46_07570 [Myxococcota bacterium]|nr:hypothetical protein [Myxococcota bacterium]